MKKICFNCFVLMLFITMNIFSQDVIYIGMSTEEFNEKMPGILPNENLYCKNLYLQEKLFGMDGNWSFNIYNNKLISANYIGNNNIYNEEEFNKWTESAKLIIDDYRKIYGKPLKYETGTNKYLDRNNLKYKNSIGKREVFYEAMWESNSQIIFISCDYRSNYYNEYDKEISNGPIEWYNYSFSITYSYKQGKKDIKQVDTGRFYLGMDVKDFAKVFPTLFPNGVKISGQWGRDQQLYGLDGSWSYQFEDGKLTWIHFQKYKNEINETNFNMCLSATEKLIDDYTKLYDKPDTVIIGNKSFLDPIKNHHWGYDVMEARWKNTNGQKIKIEFTFMGGKGEYSFLVIINFFDKDYPYYD
jgi:hypothetical protein